MQANGRWRIVVVAATVIVVGACSANQRLTARTPDSQVGNASALSTESTSPAEPTLDASPAPSAPPTPAPKPSEEILPDDLDPALVQAVRFRRGSGLRADLAYVRMVAGDSAASDHSYGVPMYPAEVEDMEARYQASREAAMIVHDYAASHADEFGGLYIDEGSHTGVVSLWTGHLAEHAAAINALAGPDARLAFDTASYPEAELRALQDRLTDDWRDDWLDEIPAAMESIGVDIFTSQVLMEVSSANPDAVTIIESHYQLGDRLRVESDGTGAALIPGGRIKGVVTNLGGIDPYDLELRFANPVPGDCGGGDIGYGVGRDGHFRVPCQAGARTIIVVRQANDGTDQELGRGTVTVVAGETVDLTIRLKH
jgi:hypothetical protein